MMTNSGRSSHTQVLSFLCIVAIFVAGCSNFRPIEIGSGEPLNQLIHAGDKVRITDVRGSVAEFEVTEIDVDSITGPRRTIPIADIRTIQVKKVDVSGTTLLIVGLTALGAVLIGEAVESEAVPVP